MRHLTPEFLLRFWSLVNFRGPVQYPHMGHCWEWCGYRKRGYGQIGRTAAHRVSYWISNGAITGGLIVRHLCDNPSCVKPSHLAIGTDQDNSNDRINRHRLILDLAEKLGSGWRMSDIRQLCNLTRWEQRRIKRHVTFMSRICCWRHSTQPDQPAGLMFHVADDRHETAIAYAQTLREAFDRHNVSDRDRAIVLSEFSRRRDMPRDFGLSRQRIHQIKTRVVRALKEDAELNQLFR